MRSLLCALCVKAFSSPLDTEWPYVITPNPGKKFAHYRTGHHGAEIFAIHPDLPVAIVDWYVTTLHHE